MAVARQQETDKALALMQTADLLAPPSARSDAQEPVAATTAESSAPYNAGDDPQSVKEGAASVHGDAPNLHTLHIINDTKDDPNVIPFMSTRPSHMIEMTELEQEFWQNSLLDDPQVSNEMLALNTILAAMPAAERGRFVTWCDITKVNKFPALLAIIQQAIYRPEAMQRVKSVLFSSGQTMGRNAGTVLAAPSGGLICKGCQKPIINGRDGQAYHAECGKRAVGKPLAESLPQFEEEVFTVPYEALPPLEMPEGMCGYCTRRIEDAHEGQRYHELWCGALATGKRVSGAAEFVSLVKQIRAQYFARQAA